MRAGTAESSLFPYSQNCSGIPSQFSPLHLHDRRVSNSAYYSTMIRAMSSLLQAMKGKASHTKQYSLAGTSEDDLSKAGLLDKDRDFYSPKPSFWRRHRITMLVHATLILFYGVATYLIVLRVRSGSQGPDLTHCMQRMQCPRICIDAFPANIDSSCGRGSRMGRT